jgi:isocitrate dehydrogenase
MINPEELAIKLLNSKKIKHSWKKDFKKDDYCEEKWDLINSDGVKIEVKSTGGEKRFVFNSISPNIPEQKNQIILKVLLEKEKIKKYKFVKFVKGKWVDITNSILKTH